MAYTFKTATEIGMLMIAAMDLGIPDSQTHTCFCHKNAGESSCDFDAVDC